MPGDAAIELLDPEAILRGPHFEAIEEFLGTYRHRRIGWHYIVDLTWVYALARNWRPGTSVLDVGGGTGATQFLLAEMGFDVTNLDLSPPEAARWMQRRYGASGMSLGSFEPTDYVDHVRKLTTRPTWSRRLRASYAADAVSGVLAERHYDRWRRRHCGDVSVGRLRLVRGNICNVPEFQDCSFDAVVSVSALEHIPRQFLESAIGEMLRVRKPEARLALTTSATERAETWFHEPSKGLCFSLEEAARLFGAEAPPAAPDAAAMLDKYLRNVYLQSHLAAFYRRAGDNGMPFGRWNPTYLPVGISR